MGSHCHGCCQVLQRKIKDLALGHTLHTSTPHHREGITNEGNGFESSELKLIHYLIYFYCIQVDSKDFRYIKTLINQHIQTLCYQRYSKIKVGDNKFY